MHIVHVIGSPSIIVPSPYGHKGMTIILIVVCVNLILLIVMTVRMFDNLKGSSSGLCEWA